MELIQILEQLQYWHWLAFGIGMIILEMLIPTGHLLWIGIAGVLMAGLLAIFPGMGWELQLIFFSALSIALVLLYKRYKKDKPDITDQPALNRRGEHYVGRTFTLDAAIINGYGKIRVDDSYWRVHGKDADAGTLIKVLGVDGAVLEVEAVEN